MIIEKTEVPKPKRKRVSRGRSRAAGTSKLERFQPLAIITKRSILDVAAALNPPLVSRCKIYLATNATFLV